jgi:ligand-binding sensor domain-containing protein
VGLISIHSVFALDPSQKITQYAHSTWTQSGDLVNTPVNAFEQTQDGYLWLGTEEAGLIRFDGRRFAHWEAKPNQRLPGESIQSLRSARDGSLWIGTRAGLARLQDGNLEAFTTRDGLSTGAVSSIVEDQHGVMWIGTYGYESGGLSRFENGRFTRPSPSEARSVRAVSDIQSDHRGRFWIVGYDGLILWDPRTMTSEHRTASAEILSIAEGTDGSLWLASPIGLLRYSQQQTKVKPLLPAGAAVIARRVLVDRDGGLWIGTLGQGLFHLSAGKIERITRADGLSSDRVRALFEDREGNIWVGTQNGIDRFREYKIAHWSTREGLPGDNVVAIQEEPEGNLCAGIETVGIYCLSNGPTRRLPNSSIFAMFRDHEGKLDIATAGGIVSLSPSGISVLTNRVKLVYSITEDRDHRLWLGDINQGLFSLQKGNLTQVAKDRFAGKPISFLLEDKENRLWIALNPGVLTVYENRAFRTFSSDDGLPSDHVVSVVEDDSGTIWVATDGGLSRYDNRRFVTLTTRNGLPCGSIQDVIEDDLGFLWLRTSCGLVRVKRAELVAASLKAGSQIHPKLFGISDGFQASTLPRGTTPRVAKTSDGRLWFVAGEGIAVIDPRHIACNTIPPPVHVEQVVADGKVVSPMAKPRLSPGLIRLQFNYTALSFTDPDRVLFKYKLEGLDDNWVDAGTQRQASYTNLRPGAYRFRVIACNNDGVWNEAGDSFSFEVQAAFLQMRLFAWFFAGLLMAFVSIFYRVKLHRALTPAEVLNVFVKFYPDGVPGYGVALVRLWIGTVLLAQAAGWAPFAENSLTGFEPSRVLEAVAGVMLLAGFLTPIVSVLVLTVIVIEIIQRAATNAGLGSLVGSWESSLPIVLSILLFMGPGAYSIDAHVFGRRFLTVRGQNFRNKR